MGSCSEDYGVLELKGQILCLPPSPNVRKNGDRIRARLIYGFLLRSVLFSRAKSAKEEVPDQTQRTMGYGSPGVDGEGTRTFDPETPSIVLNGTQEVNSRELKDEGSF